MVLSARSVDTTARPLSAAASPTASSSVVIGSPSSCYAERRSEDVPTRRHRVDIAIRAERSRCWPPCAPSGRAGHRRRRHRRMHADRRSPRAGRVPRRSRRSSALPASAGAPPRSGCSRTWTGSRSPPVCGRCASGSATWPRPSRRACAAAQRWQSPRCAARHGVRRRQWHGLGHQVGGHVVALLLAGSSLPPGPDLRRTAGSTGSRSRPPAGPASSASSASRAPRRPAR